MTRESATMIPFAVALSLQSSASTGFKNNGRHILVKYGTFKNVRLFFFSYKLKLKGLQEGERDEPEVQGYIALIHSRRDPVQS